MRIEDLDAARVRSGAADAVLHALDWLGIDFDEGPYVQSTDLEPYRGAMRILTDLSRAYPCSLTRNEIRQATSAPHQGDSELRFLPELRPKDLHNIRFDDTGVNYRLVVDDQRVEIDDCVVGRSVHRPFNEVGDFVIWTKTGVPAYQLAVVVDDARQGVTDVVRGEDLLASAARQTLIYRALNLPQPRWWHLPLVLDEHGRRLAKRDNLTHVDAYRTGGIRAERVVGLMAFWCGASSTRVEMTAAEFRSTFNLDTLSRKPVRFTAEDHDWLNHAVCNS